MSEINMGKTEQMGEANLSDTSMSGILSPLDRLRARRAVGRLEKAATASGVRIARSETVLLSACIEAGDAKARVLEAKHRLGTLPAEDPERAQLAARIAAAEKSLESSLAPCASVIRAPRLGENGTTDDAGVKREA